MIESDRVGNLILHGPPGTGKTTLAHVIARTSAAAFESLNAVQEGVPRIREIAAAAKERLFSTGRRTIVLIDELHRLSSAQQDALLPLTESGTLTLVGATTENPSFHVNPALRSRCSIFTFEPLSEDDVRLAIRRALADEERGLGRRRLKLDAAAEDVLVRAAGGDVRRALNALETAAGLVADGVEIREDLAIDASANAQSHYHREESRYDLLSWFQKSIRGSNPDAALLALAMMIDGGEDERVILRRLSVIAAEDVGLADAGHGMQVVAAAAAAFERVGAPEGHIPLAAAVVYCATAPKSNRAYLAWKAALETVRQNPDLQVPLHLRNAPTAYMAAQGYGKGYDNPHAHPEHFSSQAYLPEALSGMAPLYAPSTQGTEAKIAQRMAWWETRRTEQHEEAEGKERPRIIRRGGSEGA